MSDPERQTHRRLDEVREVYVVVRPANTVKGVPYRTAYIASEHRATVEASAQKLGWPIEVWPKYLSVALTADGSDSHRFWDLHDPRQDDMRS